MTKSTRATLRLALLLASAAPVTAAAQRTPALSVDATLGVRGGSGGEHQRHFGMAVDLLLGLAGRGGPGTVLAGGLGLGANGPVVATDVCLLAPGGGCYEDFPGFVTVSALLGVQRTSGSGRSLRALAGPTLYLTDSAENRRTLGLQGRVDGATPLTQHVALVASLRGTLLPDFGGHGIRQFGLGLGLRIH